MALHNQEMGGLPNASGRGKAENCAFYYQRQIVIEILSIRQGDLFESQ